MNVKAYLKRIGYRGPVSPSLETLRRMHLAHLLAVPFENLDIHVGRPIVLDEEAFYRKIVEQRRGGFCYEQNALFAAVLRELGFAVRVLSARVGEKGPEFDHLVLAVPLDEPWLADVGFGEGFREPLRLNERGPQKQQYGTFQLSAQDRELVLTRDGQRQYSFSDRPRLLSEFAAMCKHHQTSPESHFTQHRICSLATRDGRISLTDGKLIVTAGGERTETPVPEADFAAVLKQNFGIVLPG